MQQPQLISDKLLYSPQKLPLFSFFVKPKENLRLDLKLTRTLFNSTSSLFIFSCVTKRKVFGYEAIFLKFKVKKKCVVF